MARAGARAPAAGVSASGSVGTVAWLGELEVLEAALGTPIIGFVTGGIGAGTYQFRTASAVLELAASTTAPANESENPVWIDRSAA
jgi:hypothetical protein